MTHFEEINIEQLRSTIHTFNNDEHTRKLERYYYTKSLPEVMGVSRSELVHSNFLAWLLNPKESHGLQDYPFRKFLELLVFNCQKEVLYANKNLFDAIVVSDYSVEDVAINTEKIIRDVGRIDLYIDFSIKYEGNSQLIRIILENKVGAIEHNDQTQRYFDHFEAEIEEDEVNLYIFLTAISSLELIELQEPECNCKAYIPINYQSIVDYILEPLLQRNITERTKFIIREYLQSLSQPTIDREEEQHKQGLIMVLGAEERSLLKKFWQKNQKLILASFYAISSDPEQDKDTRDIVSQAIDKLSSSNRDLNPISIYFNENLEKDKIRKSDIGFGTIKILNKYDLINKDTFNFLKNDRSCSFNLLKSLDEITENEKKYRRYRYTDEPELFYDGKGYYIARNWGVNNIDRFIDNMNSQFPQLNYIIHQES